MMKLPLAHMVHFQNSVLWPPLEDNGMPALKENLEVLLLPTILWVISLGEKKNPRWSSSGSQKPLAATS